MKKKTKQIPQKKILNEKLLNKKKMEANCKCI